MPLLAILSISDMLCSDADTIRLLTRASGVMRISARIPERTFSAPLIALIDSRTDFTFLNCSSIKALNCYFSMPFRKSARITATNEGSQEVSSFYSNIDYQIVRSLPEDVLYFHAQYRQATPNAATSVEAGKPEINLEGQRNYVFFETKGRGQMLGVTLGVVQNKDAWFGEGDEMLFVDSDAKPVVTGTGTEDYFSGGFHFDRGAFSAPYHGAPLADDALGRISAYRWHIEDALPFTRSIRVTIEHGSENDAVADYSSVAYFYQREPHAPFPPFPADPSLLLPSVSPPQ